MVGCLGQSRPAQDADVVARTVAAVALAALAVIHIVDLPGTLETIPLVGIGYFGIIVVATLAGAAMIIRSDWLTWAVGGGLAATAMGGYVLTRSLSGDSSVIAATSATGAARWASPRSAWRR